MPERPKQKTSFLSFPEAGKNIAHRHFTVAMLPYIMELEIMVPKHDEKRSDDPENRKAMEAEGDTGDALPGRRIVIFTRSKKVRGRRKKSKSKRKDHKYVSQLPNSQVFSDVLHITNNESL